MTCVIAATCGDQVDEADPAVTVPCGTCAAGTAHKNAWLIGGDPTDTSYNPVICYDTWHDGESPDCVIVVEFVDVEACPFETAAGVDVITETWTEADSSEHIRRLCPLPRLEAPLDCDEATAQYPTDTTELGWYYCQDPDSDCFYSFHFTQPARQAAFGQLVELHCAECTVVETAAVDCVVDGEVVGQQCTPTEFVEPALELVKGTIFGVELSTECGGGPCLTKLQAQGMGPEAVSRLDHCTCRCGDLEGNDHTTNPDLCQCPGDSICEPVCEHGTICPEALQGSFCMPTCVAHPCDEELPCTPPAGGDPWNWTCGG